MPMQKGTQEGWEPTRWGEGTCMEAEGPSIFRARRLKRLLAVGEKGLQGKAAAAPAQPRAGHPDLWRWLWAGTGRGGRGEVCGGGPDWLMTQFMRGGLAQAQGDPSCPTCSDGEQRAGEVQGMMTVDRLPVVTWEAPSRH